MSNLRLTSEEICRVLCDNAAPCPCNPVKDCVAYTRAGKVLDAQLAKLRGMKLEDLKEEIANKLAGWVQDIVIRCAIGPSGPRLATAYEMSDSILSLISAWLAAKIEAAREDAIDDTEVKFNLNVRPRLEAEARKEGERFTAEAIGQALCNLIGNTMLKNDEAGKRLGQQLAPAIKTIQSMAGIRQGKALEE